MLAVHVCSTISYYILIYTILYLYADFLMDSTNRAYMPNLHSLVGDQGVQLRNFLVSMVRADLMLLSQCYGICFVCCVLMFLMLMFLMLKSVWLMSFELVLYAGGQWRPSPVQVHLVGSSSVALSRRSSAWVVGTDQRGRDGRQRS